MSTSTLLRLCSSAPGLPGPYLQECVRPYQLFDSHRGLHCTTILAIGGEQKRSVFYRPSSDREDHVVSLWWRNDNSLILDCELHLGQERALPRIVAGAQPGSHQYHLLHSGEDSVLNLAHSIYCKVLTLFSDAVVIFVSDAGGIYNTLDLLCLWLFWLDGKRRPLRIILHDATLTERDINFELMARVISRLRSRDPQSRHTPAEAKRLITTAFKIQPATTGTLLNSIYKVKRESGFTHQLFSEHLKPLLRTTIAKFAENPSTDLRLSILSRLSRPIPQHIEENITEFLLATNQFQPVGCEIVASALVIDSYLTDMPSFPPEETYDGLYRRHVLAVEKNLGIPGICAIVQQRFISIASMVQSEFISPLNQHIARIQGSPFMASVLTVHGCAVCVLWPAAFSLDCGHVLCENCTKLHACELKSCEVEMKACLVCRRSNTKSFYLKPTTAGVRKLVLGGMNAGEILSFLCALQRSPGLRFLSLRQCFDCVLADDIGIFFLFALFYEGWDLDDCAYHIRRFGRFKRTQKHVVFAPNLKWAIAEATRYDRSLKITSGSEEGLDHFVRPTSQARNDVVVRFYGGEYSAECVSHTASILIASTFYIELSSYPDFYTAPETCTIDIRCRIPPSSSLIELLVFLRRNGSQALYKGSELAWHTTALCPDHVLEGCRQGRPFCQRIALSIVSADTLIEILINGLGNKAYAISNCPYRLKDLTREQGSGCITGRGLARPQHYMQQQGEDSIQELLKATKALINTLDSLI